MKCCRHKDTKEVSSSKNAESAVLKAGEGNLETQEHKLAETISDLTDSIDKVTKPWEPQKPGRVDFPPTEAGPVAVNESANLVLERVRKKHQSQAKKLLSAIEKSEDISYDANGIIFIGKKFLPSASIYQLLPLTLYRRAGKVDGTEQWFQALVKFGLGRFITNPDMKHYLHPKVDKQATKTFSKKWYFIGN